jgi:hypothetical protein
MEPESSPDRLPWWLGLAGVVGAIVGAAITGGLNYIGHEGDVDARMIELSVGILRAQPTPETIPLREWAIDVIDKRAKFSFNDAQRAALLKKELPFRGSLTIGGYTYSDTGYDPTTSRSGYDPTTDHNRGTPR